MAFSNYKKRIYIIVFLLLGLFITSTLFFYKKYYYYAIPVKKRIPFVKMEMEEIEVEFIHIKNNYQQLIDMEGFVTIIGDSLRNFEPQDYKEVINILYVLFQKSLQKRAIMGKKDLVENLEELKFYKIQLQNLIMHLNMNNKKNLPQINILKNSIQVYIDELSQIIIVIELLMNLKILRKILKTTYKIIQIIDLDTKDLKPMTIHMEKNLILWNNLSQKIFNISFKDQRYTIKIKDLLPEILLDIWEQDFDIKKDMGKKKNEGTFKVGDVINSSGEKLIVTMDNIDYYNSPIHVYNYHVWMEKTINNLEKYWEEKKSSLDT